MSQSAPDQEVIEGFLKDQEPLSRGRVGIILLIGGALVPFFGWVDYVLYPQLFREFMGYRLATAVGCLGLYAINRKWNLGHRSSYLGIAGFYLTGLCIIKMVVNTNGYVSPYYAGLNLVFLTFCTVLTLRLKYLVLHSAILYAVFVSAVLLFTPHEDFDLFLGNNMFIVSTIVIILVASLVNHNLRFSEYLLRRQLENAEEQLRLYSRKLENTVAESEEKYRRVVENAGEAILVIQDDLFQFANPKALELFGYSKEELSSSCYAEFIHADDRKMVQESLMRLLAGSAPRDAYSFRIIDREGNTKWLEIRMALVPWERGPAALSLLNDITERKRAEEALQEAHQDLERRVKDRTAELEAAQEELVRRERFAVLGKLIAIVSHELRNPLGTIRASLFAINENIRGKGPGVDQALDRAERSIVRCDKIIEELLDFARSHDLDLEPTLVDTWLGDVLDEQELPRSIALTRNLASGVEVQLDRERFRRCFLNVFGNAFHAILEKEKDGEWTENGEETNGMTVESRRVGNRVEIRVVDTGTGIHPDELEKVFLPLYSTKGFGVGLGLAIVKQIMEQHGGGVEIESEPGAGTKVTLWLPTFGSLQDVVI